ncbi:MAG: DNA replication/repair protein RecF [Cyanobacteria bacterium P01_A01_bin.135]
MYLACLQLYQFRNYASQTVTFSAPKTIVVGNNAQGKSNLLEAVELLANLRSHRALRDRELVLEGATEGRIDARLVRDSGPVNLAMTLRKSGRRTVAVNGEALRRQLDFLPLMNAVQFSSLDLELVRGAPNGRRQWLDTLLMQLEPVYAYILQQYNQILRQRNALLKQSDAPPDPSQMALWDAQMAAAGTRVIRRRNRVLQRLAPIAQEWHQAISHGSETLTVNYAPNVAAGSDDPQAIQAAFLAKIQERAAAEVSRGTSLVGPHRDDVELVIDGTPARQYGSQGQQRTLVLALKLAELMLIETVVGEPPLLLLDDVLAELDLTRQNQLLEAIQERFQTIITTTHLGAFDAQWLQASQILRVEQGAIASPVKSGGGDPSPD